MNIKPINNHIVFEFLDSLNSRNEFTQTTDSGIHITGHFDDSAKQPRWGRVLAIGPKVDDEITINTEILIDNLRWTEAVVISGKKYWRTDDGQVLAYRDLRVS